MVFASCEHAEAYGGGVKMNKQNIIQVSNSAVSM